jgi:hypothetical protein
MTSRSGPIARGAIAAVVACLAGPAADASAQVIITSGPSGATNDNTPEFTFTGPPGTECRLPPVAPTFTACSAQFPPPGSEYAIPLADGDYTFTVGVGGETDPAPARRDFTIDTVPPDTQITGGPGETTDTTAVFFFSASEAATTSCRLDGGPREPCSSPQTYSGLSLGGHRFEVTSVDAAGNQDPAPAEHAWQVLRPGLVIPGAVKLATSLAKELVQIRRALAKMGLRALARRRTVRFKTFDALTAGTVAVRARARVRQGARRRWVPTVKGKRKVPGAGRHHIRATVTKKGRRLARRRQRLPLELRLSFTDVVGRSLWATSELTLKR